MCFSLFFDHHRNLIAFSEEGSDPYVRMYLLPDKRRSGRRKTHVSKKTLNPVFDQTYVQNHVVLLYHVITKPANQGFSAYLNG